MYVVTSEQMRALDNHVIHRIGIPAAALMENAGKAIAEEVLKLCLSERGRRNGLPSSGTSGAAGTASAPAQASGQERGEALTEHSTAMGPPFAANDLALEMSRPSPVLDGDVRLPTALSAQEHWLILVGKGHNGGDGVVAARHLRDAGVRVTLLYAAEPSSLTGEAAVQRDAAAALGIPALVHGRAAVDYGAFTGIVDALLGTGASGAPRGAYAALIQAANDSGLPVVSADIPSGLDADTGARHEPCISAAVTVCLAFLKRGLVQYPGAESAGRVVVRSIGIPASLCREQGVRTHLLTPQVLRTELDADVTRYRTAEGHKGTYGHVLTVGGSRTMSGAGLLASRAALRAGCGLVTWALPASLVLPLSGAAPEIMLAPATDEESGGNWNEASAGRVLELAKTRDVLAVGPGLGRFDGDSRWLRRLWEAWEGPLVVDADALNMLSSSGDFSAWRPRSAATVLTPHPGEMSRLLGTPTAELQQDRIGAATGFAAEHGVTLVLKGARTVVASPDGQAYINTTGTSGMATGGTGDVLTGIIASLLAQGYAGPSAAALGVWLHGRAGEWAARHRGHPASVIAGDVIDML
ncbi:bifunctional ADP-dependent (S)-NAD(P)H-hydrate dehydratase/NAD(P)H-hydrate epimerase [Paenibacillus glucanolyticus]|uniref:Bifunctional NAD(P)H-hydrate repair enzyme n=2 Tax=Paenibacillus glucanolyticus TaxID=59843 RepID=A0A163JRZ5_9BACL|nr:bifunctional ADP-dependent NAD(P)H-hydrate dehydratase/NAD(P)H-hydrate epimerase [Paenibacillus glucanolyticus]KZS46764.1 bifunctional ADP-dependent (S)-NAD(P)H-hydrate dehydratase/NAD(P)H-hydrate epimerase [Paenibacillus glucanolyticus]